MKKIDRLEAEIARLRPSARANLKNGSVSGETRRMMRATISKALDVSILEDEDGEEEEG